MEEGQRVNVTLLDFGPDSSESGNNDLDESIIGCRVYATIKEQVCCQIMY